MPDAPKVFCSHRSVDSEPVLRIATGLRQNGIDAWTYEWEVRAGEDFVQAIDKALAQCDLALIFFSKATADGVWTQAEISSLIEQAVVQKKRVIPVLLEPDAPIPELLKTRVKLPAEPLDDLINAIYGVSSKPHIGQPQQADHKICLTLANAGEDHLAITCQIDGQPACDNQTVPVTADFAFAYVEWHRARQAAADQTADLHKLGRALGQVLFPEAIAAKLTELLGQAAAHNQRVELIVETAEPKLIGIPFEAAALPDGRIPALQPGLRMMRRFSPAQGKQEPQAGPLKILVAVGAPDETKTQSAVLDPEQELQTILDAVEQARGSGDVYVRILEVGSLGEIRKELRRQPHHVLYLSGHGGAGMIELETEDGEPDTVTAQQLADAIQDSGHPAPLIHLAACHSGLGGTDGETETAGLAQALLERGVPLVLAMQTAVSDRYATDLAGRFYAELTSTTPFAGLALARARADLERERNQAAARGESVPPAEYATPSLFCAGEERPLLDIAAEPSPPREFKHSPVAGAVPMLKVGDLIGRREELRDLMRVVTDNAKSPYGRKAGYQLIGIGGVGKSSVAGRAMQRLSDNGWHVVAYSGRWEVGSLCATIGASLLTADGGVKQLAEPLLANIPDQARLQLVSQLLADHKFLLVLDNFEDNLTGGGKGFKNDFSEQALGTFCQAAQTGKLLITSRYPVPRLDAWVATKHLGPLSPAQSRKLVLRLEALRTQEPAALAQIQRVIGGHPRMLEYLDAILRKGEARLPDVAKRLSQKLRELDIDLEEAAGDLEKALEVAERVGAQDILLDELLALAAEQPGDVEALHQLAVFPAAVPASGVAFGLNGGKPVGADAVRSAIRALKRLAGLSLVTPLGGDNYWVHRWTAEALQKRVGEQAYHGYCRSGGLFLQWRVENKTKNLGELIEAVRLLLRGRAFDEAVAPAEGIVIFLRQYGRALDLISFSQEVCEMLPEGHDRYPGFLDTQINAMQAVGLAQEAFETTKRLVSMTETRAKAEPDRADYQRDLSVSYNKLGDLLRALGQGETARDYYDKSLAIRERLAAAEPNRADCQRDLSVSYNKLGDLLRALGQGETARDYYEKDLAIAERLAAAEPDRADYQRDLSVSYIKLGDLLRALGQGETARDYYDKSLAIAERLAAAEPDRADYQRDLSVSYEKLGDLLSALGQGETAREYYDKSLAIREQLAAAEPNRADYQRDLSVSYNKLGDLLRALGQGETARDYYDKSLAIRERLAAAEPNRADCQRDLSVSYNKLGDLLRALGQGETARDYYEKDLAIAERLAAAEPDRADYQRDLSVSYIKLGDLLRALGQGETARDYYDKSLAIAERLAAAEPDRADYQRDLSVSYEKLGDLLSALGQGETAREYYDKSLAIREQLAAAEPDRADYQRDLSVSYNKLGDLLRALGQGETARDYYDKSLAIRERLAASEPGRADFQRDLALSYERAGDLAIKGERAPEAFELFSKALQIRQRLQQAEPGRADLAYKLMIPCMRVGDLLSAGGEKEKAQEAYLQALSLGEQVAAADPARIEFQTRLLGLLLQLGRRKDLERALTIAEELQQRGALTDQQRQLPAALRKMLDEMGKGAGA